MKVDNESLKALGEQQCINTFLNWYNKKFNMNFVSERAENKFPDISSSTRWDFIIEQSGLSPWSAVEIKRLIRPITRIQLSRWNDLLRSITDDIRGCLQGEFSVYGVPTLNLERREKAKLKKLLSALILKNAQLLKEGESTSLGAQ